MLARSRRDTDGTPGLPPNVLLMILSENNVRTLTLLLVAPLPLASRAWFLQFHVKACVRTHAPSTPVAARPVGDSTDLFRHAATLHG